MLPKSLFSFFELPSQLAAVANFERLVGGIIESNRRFKNALPADTVAQRRAGEFLIT